jgi:hypothetical protein
MGGEGTLSTFPRDVNAQHGKMAGFTRRVTSDEYGTMSAGLDGSPLTACDLQITATQQATPAARADGQNCRSFPSLNM